MKKIFTYRLLLYILPFLIFTNHVFSQTKVVINADTLKYTSDSIQFILDDVRGDVQWQYSEDSINWVDMPEHKDDSLFIYVDSTSLYRAKITDGTCNPVYSDTLKIIEDTVTIVKSNVIVIDSVDWHAYLDTSKSDSVIYTFHNNVNAEDSIVPGCIIVSNADDGYLLKVTDIVVLEDTVEIHTTQGTLVEVFKQAIIRFEKELTSEDKNMEMEYLADGVKLSDDK